MTCATYQKTGSSMKLAFCIITVFAAFHANAAERSPEFDEGRAYYAEGDFKKAVVHLQLALKADPDNADANYWTAMAYQRLADIATPFGGKYSSKARRYLSKAVLLSPNRADYRLELFNHVLDSADATHSRPPREVGALLSVSESDPEFAEMQRRLESASRQGFSVGFVLDRLFLTAPRLAYDLSNLPLSALLRCITPLEW
jgi:tetratricopeptide (TPR) repeat protein